MASRKEKRFLLRAIIPTTLFVVLLLVLGYIWLNRRAEWAEKRTGRALDGGRYDTALSFARKAENYGAEDVVNRVYYRKASDLYAAGDYAAAETEYAALGDYEDSAKMVLACRYEQAAVLQKAGRYEEAAKAFSTATGYEDALSRRDGCVFSMAEEQEALGNYEQAAKLFCDAASIEGAADRANGCLYEKAQRTLQQGDTREAFVAFMNLGDFRDAHEKAVAIAREMTGETDEQAALAAAGGYSAEQWAVRMAYKEKRAQVRRGTLAAGWSHAVALKQDGTVLTAGDDSFGQCQTAGWTNIVAVGAGARHTAGLKSDGTVIAVGDNTYGQCDVSGWSGITAIAVGDWDTYGLKSDGTVVRCGYSTDDAVLSWNGVISVTACSGTFGAVRAGGTVLVGFKSAQCGSWTDIGEIAMGVGWVAGLDNEGDLTAFGIAAPDWENIITLSASATVLCGLDAANNIQAVSVMPQGKNLCEALEAEKDVTALAVSATWAVVRKADGTYACVGSDAQKPDVSAWN